jgi:uncharacterized protein YecE (DUF72 family)
MEPLYIGMGGWELFPFNRYFYPPGANRDFRKLAYYAQFFDTVEVNATFYNTALSPAHAHRWLTDVADNPRFLFTVKLFRGFTHTFSATRGDAAAVLAMLDPLAAAGKLGGVVIQFPSSFTNLHERRLYLARLARLLRPHRLFVEVRHRSWNDPSTLEFFHNTELHPVNVDLPRINQHMPFTAHAWGGVAYFRMMGRNAAAWNRPWRLEEDGRHMVSDRYHYRYTAEELDSLVRTMATIRSRAGTLFVVFHNDPEANSLINGFQLRFRTREKQPLLLPGKLVRSFPVLGTLGTPAPIPMPLFAGAA